MHRDGCGLLAEILSYATRRQQPKRLSARLDQRSRKGYKPSGSAVPRCVQRRSQWADVRATHQQPARGDGCGVLTDRVFGVAAVTGFLGSEAVIRSDEKLHLGL